MIEFLNKLKFKKKLDKKKVEALNGQAEFAKTLIKELKEYLQERVTSVDKSIMNRSFVDKIFTGTYACRMARLTGEKSELLYVMKLLEDDKNE